MSSLLRLPPTLPTPPLLVDTKHRADFPVLCGCFTLAIYFTFGSVYMSMPLSHFVPAYLTPSSCSQVHSLHLRLYSCPAPRFIRTISFFFLDSIYVLAYSMFFNKSTVFGFSESHSLAFINTRMTWLLSPMAAVASVLIAPSS